MLQKVGGWLFRAITLRRVVQLGFFFLFLWLILKTVYIFEGEEPIIPRDLFLRFDPLAGFLTSISSRSGAILAEKFLFAIGLTVLAFLLGRFFCNWICPLGTTLDVVDRIIRPRTREPKSKVRITHTAGLRNLKYYILVFFIVAALFSTQLSWLMDPISIVTRSYGIVLYPYLSRFIDLTLAPLYRVPVVNRISEPIYGFLRTRFLSEEQPVFQLQLLFFLIFAAILFLVRYHPRFWCRYLCPLGALFGACGKFSLVRRVVDPERCDDCGKCQRECRTAAITENPRGYHAQECTVCLTCQAICPTGAISFKFASPFGKEEKEHAPKGRLAYCSIIEHYCPFRKEEKKYTPKGLALSRRGFIKAAALGALALPVMKLKVQEKSFNPFLIRPPGALPEEEFLDKCIRCAECMKACPTNALQPAVLQGGVEAIGTPIIVPKVGYCEYECNTCGQVCPTGAIRKLPIEEKQKFKMGTAYFNKNKCYPWNEHINCLVCEEHCPVPDKAIKFWETEVIEQRTNKTVKVLLPYVVTELCIGCGICENKCPIAEEPGIRVTVREELRHKERYTGDRGVF
jgi:MauM/NapG family ferredoxin protein